MDSWQVVMLVHLIDLKASAHKILDSQRFARSFWQHLMTPYIVAYFVMEVLILLFNSIIIKDSE